MSNSFEHESELPPSEEERLQSLYSYNILDTPPEASFDAIVQLAAKIFQVPVAIISLVDRDRQWFKACHGWDATETDRDVSFCNYAIRDAKILVIPDASSDIRFAAYPMVMGRPGVRFYAGAPLRVANGHLVGTLCIMDYQPRNLEPGQIEILESLAAMASNGLELHAVAGRLHTETIARQEAVDALLASESRFRSLVEYASDIITILDSNGIVLYESPAVRNALGYEPEELTGRAVFELVHEEDVPQVVAAFQKILAGARQFSPVVFRFKNSAGEWRVLEAIGTNRLNDPAVGGIVVNSRDVTERVEAEASLHNSNQRFQSAFDESAIGIALVATNGRWLSVNRALCQLLGYTEKELLARDFQSVTHPDDLEADLDWVRQVLRGERKSYSMEKRYFHREGHIVWALLTVSLVRDQAGNPLYFISQVQDISEHKEAEDSLREARDEAERQRQLAERARHEAEAANLAKSEFLSRISHELRTPLNAILGFGQLLELANLSPSDRQSVQHILKGGRHLLSLINEVLDIARIESGALALSPEPVSVAQVCIETLDLVRPLAAQNGVTLHENDLRESPIHVLADRQRLKQVLLNLLSNAIKYNREGGTVDVRVENHDVTGSSAQVRLAVSDNGPGIAPDMLERLFTPFDRLGAETSDVEGTGIGLALSQRLVTAMKGRLGVDTEVGQGSSFWVQLPLTSSPLEQTERERANILAAEAMLVSTRWVVLCIEDNLPNLQLLNQVFARRPAIRLLSASQGPLGLELAQQHNPDLILLDLHVPEMSGEDVLARLRHDERTAKIPVIVISADATPRQTERLLEAGATAYLTKPYDVAHLLQTVDNLLEVREAANKAAAEE